MIFPKQVRSGVIPSRSCMPPRATRKPVMTSSKINNAPYSSVSSRNFSRKPGRGSTRPILAATGSTMTVITAAKFDELIATGVCSCQAQGTHGSLGTGVDEAHHFKRWYAIDHQSCQLILGLGGRAKAKA